MNSFPSLQAVSLMLQAFLVESPCNPESFSVIGDGDVLVATFYCSLARRRNRAAAVTPYGVHLEITF